MKIKWMLNCKEASELLSKKMDHPLSLGQFFLLKMHIMMCKTCMLVGKQMQDLKNIFTQKQGESEQEENLPPYTSKLPNEKCEEIKKMLKNH